MKRDEWRAKQPNKRRRNECVRAKWTCRVGSVRRRDVGGKYSVQDGSGTRYDERKSALCGGVQEEVVRCRDLRRSQRLMSTEMMMTTYGDRVLPRMPACMQDLLVKVQSIELHCILQTAALPTRQLMLTYHHHNLSQIETKTHLAVVDR